MVDYKDDPYSQDEKAPVTWGTPEMYNQPAPPVPSGTVTPQELAQSPTTWKPDNTLPTTPAPPPTPGFNDLAVRSNPFGNDPNAPPTAPNGAPLISNPNFLNSVQAPPNAPMNNTAFSNREIDRLEQKKIITADEASNLRQHAVNDSNIYGTAAKEQTESIKLSQADLNKAAQDANARSEEIRNMVRKQYQTNIDPNSYWKNKSTGEKVLAGIGMILSGAGSGLSGQPNMAMQVINHAIDRDIDAQKANIEKNYKAIADLNGLNENEFNRELHKQVWSNNFRNASLEVVKLDLAKSAALTTSQTVQNEAKKGILDITQQQDVIRHNQFLLAQQQMAAERARIRALEKDADGDIQKLIEKEGVDFDTAARAVYERPRYKELVDLGRVTAQMSDASKADQKALTQFKIDQKIYDGKVKDIDDMVKRFNLTPARRQELMDRLGPAPTRPNATLPKLGTVVGPDMNKQLDIQKKQAELQGEASEKEALANVYGQVLGYKQYFSNPQPGDVKANIPFVGMGGEGGAYRQNVDSWNSYVDTTLVPLMEKKINKGKTTEQAIKIGGERFHISPLMTDQKKKQTMESAMQSLDEAMKISGVPTEKIQAINPTTIQRSQNNPDNEVKTFQKK